MQDHQHPAARLGAGSAQLHQRELVGEVEGGDRLVEEQPARAALVHRRPDLGEHPGQLHPLLFAAGQLRIARVREGGHADRCQRLIREIWRRRVRTGVGAEGGDLARGEGEGELRLLR